MPGKRQHRPQSDDIVDLHVFLVPLELWIGKYRTAYNNALLQATSAGFIRIHAELNLTKARREIIEQLEAEVVPDEFVFLRSVGRCLAAVNQQQEAKLKAKHFLPPIAFSPELFLLPCSHSDLTSILARNNKGVYVTDQVPLRLGSLDISHLDSYSASYDSDAVTDNGEVTLASLAKNKSYADDVEVPKNVVYNENLEDSKAVLSHPPTSSEQQDSDTADKNEVVEKWRTVVDQSEMLHQVPRASKKISSMSEKLRDKAAVARTQSALPAIQVIQPEALPVSPGNTKRVGIPTPLPSGIVVPKISSRVQKPKKSRKQAVVDAEENDPTSKQDNVESNDDTYDSVQYEVEDIGGDYSNDVVDTTNENDNALTLEESDFDNEQDMIENIISENPDSIRYAGQDTEENEKQAENEEGRTEVIAADSSGNLQILQVEESSDVDLLLASPRERSKSNRDRQLKMELEKKRLEEKKKNAAEGASKMMQEMDDLLRKKKLEEEKRRKQEEEVKKMMKAAEEEKKREIERLKEEVRLAKDEKAEVQKRRETIVKLAKELQAKVHAKVNKDTNMWKKKYQNEAERTTELEEELNRLRTELDVQHKKLLGTFDNKAYSTNQKVVKPTKAKTPSQLSNQKIQLRRLQQDVESLRQRVDETRVKLSAERKMRVIAFQELKELRNQALEKKINAALSSRRFPGVRPIDGNVTA